MRNKAGKVLIGISVLFFWLAVWQVCALAVGHGFVLASPVSAARALAALAVKGDFWRICALSLLRILAGFALGAVVGAALGVLSQIKVLDILLSPLMTVVRCVPVASFIILVWYFLERGQVPVFTAFLMVTPVVCGNVKAGFAAVDKGLCEVAQVYRFSPSQRVRHVYLPAVMPYFAAGCTTALGLAWKAGVAAEVLCRPAASIGNEIYLSKAYLETPELFAWTAVVVLLSLALEKLLAAAVKRGGTR